MILGSEYVSAAARANSPTLAPQSSIVESFGEAEKMGGAQKECRGDEHGVKGADLGFVTVTGEKLEGLLAHPVPLHGVHIDSAAEVGHKSAPFGRFGFLGDPGKNIARFE